MLILSDVKHNWKFFALLALVIMLLFAVGISLFNISFSTANQLYNNLDDEFVNGYDIEVASTLTDLTALQSNGVNYVKFSVDSFLIDGTDGLYLLANSYYFEDYLPKNFRRYTSEIGIPIVRGELWTAADNQKNADGKYAIFISERHVEELKLYYEFNITVGDTITLHGKNNTTADFYVKGIYATNPQYNFPYAVIPSQAGVDLNIRGGTILNFNDIDDYRTFSHYAAKNNIKYSSSIDEYITTINLFSGALIFIAVIILGFACIISFIYCKIYINKRINFIGILKALGLDNAKISKEFFALLATVYAITFVLSNVLSILFTDFFAATFFELFAFKMSVSWGFLPVLIFGTLIFLSILASVSSLRKLISKISIREIIMQKE